MKPKVILTSCLVLLLLLPCAVRAADIGCALSVNGQLKQVKISYVSSGSKRYFMGRNVPVAVIQVEGEEEGTYEYLRFHPAVVRILFSEEYTAIKDTPIYEVTKLSSDDMLLKGLKENTPVSVYDANGKCCMQLRAANGTVSISTAGLRPGIYMIKAGKQVIKYAKH